MWASSIDFIWLRCLGSINVILPTWVQISLVTCFIICGAILAEVMSHEKYPTLAYRNLRVRIIFMVCWLNMLCILIDANNVVIKVVDWFMKRAFLWNFMHFIPTCFMNRVFLRNGMHFNNFSNFLLKNKSFQNIHHS